MSKANATKIFKDLLSFLTIIPLGTTEDFVETSARNIFLFPVVGALIGLFAAAYLFAANWIVYWLLVLGNMLVAFPSGFLQSAVPATMTLAVLLIITGFQHFDGLIDMGNAIGVKRVEARREIAHRWIVTYRGALLALIVEFSAVAGLFFLNLGLAVRALVVAEVCAKIAMVTIVWRGKAAHEGLGARFIRNAKRNVNIAGYALAFVIGFALLGLAGLLTVAVAVLFGLFMKKVADVMFGGVSGDMIGATNEATRAVSLVLMATVSALASVLLWGGVLL
jgi:adenosylcobinamide-GDP ribazoletransferase